MTTQRERLIATVRARRRYPVLILGAGINGAGLFRDLAAQGVDVLLADKGDFLSGASAAPSRLIHGGLKYLETGEFRLVAQSALERNLLLKNAPHFVRPLRTVVPIHSWFGGTWAAARRFFRLPAKLTDRGVFVIELGLALYDLFGRKQRTMPRHSLRLRKASLASLPDLDPAIVATGTYYDAAIAQPERLGFELLADAARDNPGCAALNYFAVEAADGHTITLRDSLSGERLEVEAEVVVNAGGAWIDQVNAALGVVKRYIGGTKGSHLIVDCPRLVEQLDGRMVYFGAADGRICLVYPYFGHALIGSTDIRTDDPDHAVCDEDETDYMLEVVGGLFPGLALGREHVLYRYCGVRPLPATDTSDPGAISRDHSIAVDRIGEQGPPVLSLIGGKWTTFRGFAEEAADRVLELLGRSRRTSTRALAIGGGAGYPVAAEARQAWAEQVAARLGTDAARARTLLERYGSFGEQVAAWCAQDDDRPLAALPDYSVREIERVCREETVARLADVLFRRLPVALSARLSRAAIDEVGAIVARTLGWTSERLAQEIAHVEEMAVRRHGVDLGKPAGTYTPSPHGAVMR